ncbi:hypothetical protein LIER_11657 [Lithospermum erythrorhizon]|uniref:Integrase zinc-binding domain-containing protein n=1 Tax=Lithospermum erythrorhizon TaxID=34254 RepID=A0AAV3PQ36_LITER
MEDRRTPIARYLVQGILPTDKVEAKKVANRSYKFRVIQEELYTQSYLGPLLYCVSEIGGQTLALIITRAGYYWPTIMNDAMEYVKRCDACKRMQPVPRQPITEMSPVFSAIPFAMWGINLVGKFLKPPMKSKDAVVAVDYFSKWVEADPLRSTTSEAIDEFI